MSVALFDVGLGALQGRLCLFDDDGRAICCASSLCPRGTWFVVGDRSLSFAPMCVVVFWHWWPCGLADGARWVLSAIAQSRPQPPLVPIFQCGFRTPEGGGGGLRPPIDSGHSPALCATSC